MITTNQWSKSAESSRPPKLTAYPYHKTKGPFGPLRHCGHHQSSGEGGGEKNVYRRQLKMLKSYRHSTTSIQRYSTSLRYHTVPIYRSAMIRPGCWPVDLAWAFCESASRWNQWISRKQNGGNPPFLRPSYGKCLEKNTKFGNWHKKRKNVYWVAFPLITNIRKHPTSNHAGTPAWPAAVHLEPTIGPRSVTTPAIFQKTCIPSSTLTCTDDTQISTEIGNLNLYINIGKFGYLMYLRYLLLSNYSTQPLGELFNLFWGVNLKFIPSVSCPWPQQSSASGKLGIPKIILRWSNMAMGNPRTKVRKIWDFIYKQRIFKGYVNLPGGSAQYFNFMKILRSHTLIQSQNSNHPWNMPKQRDINIIWNSLAPLAPLAPSQRGVGLTTWEVPWLMVDEFHKLLLKWSPQRSFSDVNLETQIDMYGNIDMFAAVCRFNQLPSGNLT